MAARINLVLAFNTREAHKAASLIGLKPGHYRVVSSAAQIKAVFAADLYLVKGWDRRIERFSMKDAMRYKRGLNLIEFDPDAEAQPGPEPEVEVVISEGVGDFFDGILVDDFTDFFETEEPSEGSPAPSEPSEDAAQDAEPAKRRRRSRCKECGALHFREDPCPQDEATPLTERLAFIPPDESILAMIGGE